MARRGFMANDNRRRDSLGEDGMNSPAFSDGLGSASGIPDTSPSSFQVGSTEGLSWAPMTDSLRDRWNTKSSTSSPWKTSKKDDISMMDEDDTVVTASTYPSTVATSVASASLATQPTLPSGFVYDDPKSALREYYLKEYQVADLRTKDSYFTWPDPNSVGHCPRFTAVFICPVTGELFATGKYGNKDQIKERKDPLTLELVKERRSYYIQVQDEVTGANVVWFCDKSGAQHGAAARAFDCLSLRKYKPVGMMSVHLGDEEPYMSEEEAPPLPTTMPNDIRQKVETERKRITNRRKQQMARSQAPTVDTTPSLPPKAALAAWYGTKPRSHQIRKDYYLSWSNTTEPHLAKYTSVFVCPLTGELFWSGRYGSDDSFVADCLNLEGHTVVWYSKKTNAEHAAAARAYDCWCLRLEGRKNDFLGKDPPYLAADDGPSLPSYLLPVDLREKVFQLQEDAKTRMPVPILNPAPPMQTEKEAAKDREEYRAARSTQNEPSMDEGW